MITIKQDKGEWTELSIDHQGFKMRYNTTLANDNKMDITRVTTMLQLHEHRIDVEKMMEKLDPSKPLELQILKEHAIAVEYIEFQLQEAWGFPKSKDHHTYWYTLPHCQCPLMDNKDMWGTKYNVYSGDCPIHARTEDES